MKIYKQIDKHILRVMKAHSKYIKTKKDGLRFWDMKTPYLIHPVWCAMTILTETKLDDGLRWRGSLTLLYHDVLEDTKYKLPNDLEKRVVANIKEMTFMGGFKEESLTLFQKKKEIILYKLYDKISTLLDAVWMKSEKLREYKHFTNKILKIVENEYGDLNITKIARGILK